MLLSKEVGDGVGKIDDGLRVGDLVGRLGDLVGSVGDCDGEDGDAVGDVGEFVGSVGGLVGRLVGSGVGGFNGDRVGALDDVSVGLGVEDTGELVVDGESVGASTGDFDGSDGAFFIGAGVGAFVFIVIVWVGVLVLPLVGLSVLLFLVGFGERAAGDGVGAGDFFANFLT